MNRKKILAAAFIFMFLPVSFWLKAEDSKSKPVAVSPGSETEVVSVWQSCPTFSWSAVEQASTYRIAVFEVIDPKVTYYEEMAAMASPVVSKDIPGPALSWTLSSEESLKTGNMYTWCVQAIDAYGNALGNWSSGKIFKVEQEIRFAGIEDKLAEKLRECGVTEETITNVLTDMKTEVKEVVVRGADLKNAAKNSDNLVRVLGYEGATNTFYGLQAGYSNTTGANNTFIGSGAGYFNTASNNTFLGYYSGYGNTTGNLNTFIGRSAGYQNSTGFLNTFIGHFSGFSNSTGSMNTFLGVYAGNFNTTGSGNTFIGNSAGQSSTTGYSNTFLGQYAGYSNTTGYSNTFLGNGAGNGNTEGYDNTFIGRGAGQNNTTGNSNTFLGFYAGSGNTTGNYNTLLGYAAGNSNTTGNSNTFIGHEAGKVNTSGANNTFIGYTAGNSNTTGNINTFIGYAAGKINTTGYQNIFLGYSAGFANTIGNDNIFLGIWAGGFNTTGSYNLFLGKSAGYHNITGNANIFLGYEAGYTNTTGGSNAIVGYAAGFSNTSGNDNAFIGNWAGKYNTTGNNNTFLGNYSGYNSTTGTGNVFLGYQAGYNETGSNKLYISNSDTSSPLIYGEFDNSIVTINGKLGIGTKTPYYPIELETTGQNAALTTKRTDGATNFISAGASFGFFGTTTNHPLRMNVNNAWRLQLNADNSLAMASGATCTASGVWTSVSSRDAKENIKDLTADKAIEALDGLKPVTFNYKTEKEELYVGFIAEDVPEIVATADRKGLSAMDITAVVTRVVQEQQMMIREQQQVNQEYKKIISDLQERITKIEKER